MAWSSSSLSPWLLRKLSLEHLQCHCFFLLAWATAGKNDQWRSTYKSCRAIPCVKCCCCAESCNKQLQQSPLKFPAITHFAEARESASSNTCVDSTAQPQWCSPVTSCHFYSVKSLHEKNFLFLCVAPWVNVNHIFFWITGLLFQWVIDSSIQPDKVVCVLQAYPTEEKQNSDASPESKVSLQFSVFSTLLRFLCKRSCTVRQCKRWICCQICRPIRLHLHVKEAARIGIFGSGPNLSNKCRHSWVAQDLQSATFLDMCLRDLFCQMSWSKLK